MTERSLMIRCAVAGRYFAVGMDLPSARVFDVATGALAAVVEVPPKGRASLAVVSLTSLALGFINEQQSAEENKEINVVNGLSACYASVGLSNGTILLQNVGKEEPVQHILLSDTQQAIVATAFCGRYLFCLASNRSLNVVDCLRGERVASNLCVQHDAGAIAVMEEKDIYGDKNYGALVSVFRVFVSGPTNAVYTLSLSADAQERKVVTLERLVSFASQASTSDFAWMGGTLQRPVVITANAQEGVVRVWDAHSNVDGQTTSSRCRRTLLCGQRIVNISVYDTTNMDSKNNHHSGNNSSGVFVVAATFTGTVLVWNLGNALLTCVAEPLPISPTLHIVSKENSARLLFGAFLHDSEPNNPSLLVLRGRFAVPHFEIINLHEVESKAIKSSSSSSLSICTTTAAAMGEDVVVYTMPTGPKLANGEGIDTVHMDMEVLDHAWVTHSHQQQQQQQQRQRQLLASRAIQTSSEGFVPVVSFHARSVKDIPQKSLTLEQRLKQLSLFSSRQKHQEESTPAQQQQKWHQQQHALGLATVPLYQALHANDASAVMELLTVASRSADDIRATVMGLQLPYCLQLLHILSQRVRGANPRSPLFEWIDAIIYYRGVEMYQTQQQFRQQKAETREAETREDVNKKVETERLPHISTTSSPSATTPSAPKDFVAPLLHQYKNMTALYDSIAVMYGRLSIFKSVRPSERGVFANSDAGVIFPAMFAEIRCAGGEYRTIKVRAKRDPQLRRNKKGGALALLRKARRLAAAEADENSAGDVNSDEGGDELDMDALDKMRLSEDMSGENDEDSDADVEDTKHMHKERVEMIAEGDRGSSYGIDSSTRSSEVEFDPASDDEDDNSLATADDDDDDDDDISSDGTDGDDGDSDLDDDMLDDDDEEYGDDDDIDGIGDDMAELLEAQGEDEQLENRRHKRAKTDH